MKERFRSDASLLRSFLASAAKIGAQGEAVTFIVANRFVGLGFSNFRRAAWTDSKGQTTQLRLEKERLRTLIENWQGTATLELASSVRHLARTMTAPRSASVRKKRNVWHKRLRFCNERDFRTSTSRKRSIWKRFAHGQAFTRGARHEMGELQLRRL